MFRKYVIPFIVLILCASCSSKDNIVTNDGVVKKPNANELMILETKDELSSDEDYLDSMEESYQYNDYTITIKELKEEHTNEGTTLKIDAKAYIPEKISKMKIYELNLIPLSEGFINNLLKLCFGEENINDIEIAHDMYYTLRYDNGSDSLLLTDTISYKSINNKFIYQFAFSIKDDQAVGISLTKDEAIDFADNFIKDLGLEDYQLNNEIISQPIHLDWYTSNKGFYYIEYSKILGELPVIGITNNVISNHALGNSVRSGYFSLAIDDTGLFKLDGTPYEVKLESDYYNIISYETAILSLVNQMNMLVIDCFDDTYILHDDREALKEIPVAKIELGYILDVAENNTLKAIPIWKFYLGYGVEDPKFRLNLFVDAINGTAGVCYE